MQFQITIHQLTNQIERHKHNTEAYRTRLQTLNQARTHIASQLDALSKDYQRKLRNLQSKLAKSQTQNKQLSKKNAIYKAEIDSFKLRLLEKQKLISSMLSQKQLPFSKPINYNLQHEEIQYVSQDKPTIKSYSNQQILKGYPNKKQTKQDINTQSIKKDKQDYKSNQQIQRKNIQVYTKIAQQIQRQQPISQLDHNIGLQALIINQKVQKKMNIGHGVPPPPGKRKQRTNINQKNQQIHNKSSLSSNENKSSWGLNESIEQANKQLQQNPNLFWQTPITLQLPIIVQPLIIQSKSPSISNQPQKADILAQGYDQYGFNVQQSFKMDKKIDQLDISNQDNPNNYKTTQEKLNDVRQNQFDQAHQKDKIQNFKETPNVYQIKTKMIPPPQSKKRQIKPPGNNKKHKNAVQRSMQRQQPQYNKEQQNRFSWEDYNGQSNKLDKLQALVQQIERDKHQQYQNKKNDCIFPQAVQDQAMSNFLSNFQNQNQKKQKQLYFQKNQFNQVKKKQRLIYEQKPVQQAINQQNCQFEKSQQYDNKVSGDFFNDYKVLSSNWGNNIIDNNNLSSEYQNNYIEQSSIEHVEHEDTSMISNQNMVNMLSQYSQFSEHPTSKKMNKKKAKRQIIKVLDPNSFV